MVAEIVVLAEATMTLFEVVVVGDVLVNDLVVDDVVVDDVAVDDVVVDDVVVDDVGFPPCASRPADS